MKPENKIKTVLLQIICSVIICMALIVLKFVLKEESILTELYNYLISDIVFHSEICYNFTYL